ncbi:CHAD domain-containing protein [Methyloceanibacter sp.]|uniref:CYTH and CHAD domain-containing protein n=1 Tax=Methyloceanibacter sp. TaxID=1965321 RepID=UPI003D6DA73D
MADAAKAEREPREFELKLEFDPADLAAIEAHPLLAGLRLDRQTLVTVYYDTDTLALHEAGLCLRVRNTGKGYVQTIKSMNGMAELFDRPEWERQVSGPRPELDLAAGTPLEKLLKDGMGERLRPVFQTSIERGVYHVASGGSEIEVAIDRGAIETERRQAPVHEVELELKRGDPAELFRLARSLVATVPLRLAVKTKAERGYELAGDAAPGAEKAGRVDLDGNLTCQQAFRAVGQSCLRQIIANEPGTCAGDAQSLHQMRIGLRRLRAAIVAFEKIAADAEQDRIKDELKWITNELGLARDLDVFEADILRPMSATHGDDARLTEARRAFTAARVKAYKAAVQSVRSDRFRKALLEIAEWIEAGPWMRDRDLRKLREGAIAEHAAELLSHGRKRIRENGADLRALDVKKRHKLRIRAKNLRYAVEFFAGVFPGEENAKRRDAALAALKELQDQLGALNDLAQREALIENGHELGKQAHGLLKPKEADVDQLLDRAQKAHADFAKVKSFWR